MINNTFDAESQIIYYYCQSWTQIDSVNLVRNYRLNSVSGTWRVCMWCSHAHSCASTNQSFDHGCKRNCNFAFASAICLRLTSAIIAILAVLGPVPFQALPGVVSGWICVHRMCVRTVCKHSRLRRKYWIKSEKIKKSYTSKLNIYFKIFYPYKYLVFDKFIFLVTQNWYI